MFNDDAIDDFSVLATVTFMIFGHYSATITEIHHFSCCNHSLSVFSTSEGLCTSLCVNVVTLADLFLDQHAIICYSISFFVLYDSLISEVC